MVKRILVTEDDREIRLALTDMLELSGYEVRTAPNGLAALALLTPGGPMQSCWTC